MIIFFPQGDDERKLVRDIVVNFPIHADVPSLNHRGTEPESLESVEFSTVDSVREFCARGEWFGYEFVVGRIIEARKLSDA